MNHKRFLTVLICILLIFGTTTTAHGQAPDEDSNTDDNATSANDDAAALFDSDHNPTTDESKNETDPEDLNLSKNPIESENDKLKPTENNEKSCEKKSKFLEFVENNMIFGLSFDTRLIFFNNRDFTTTNEDSDDTIFDTDDTTFVAMEGIALELGFVLPQFYNLGFHTLFWQSGFWGNDQLSRSSEGNGGSVLNFANLYITADFVDKEKFKFSTIIGRQFFAIGGLERDYMMEDILDAIVFDFEIVKKMNIRILAIDFFGMGTNISSYDYLRRFTHKENEDIGMRGDVNTLRFGAVIESDKKMVKFLDWKAYFFFAKFGALSGGGADRTENGQLANFGDDDIAWMAGLRAVFDFEISKNFSLNPFLDAAASYIADLQGDGAPYIENIGFAGYAGVNINLLKDRFIFGASFWYATGGQYRADGYQTGHGFVSFKGTQVGGIIANQLNGFHPSAYTDDDGVDDNPQRYNRKSGTMFGNINFNLNVIKPMSIVGDIWFLFDTNKTDITDFDNISSNEYMSYEEIAAQERFGKYLGTEIDLSFFFHLRKPKITHEFDFFITGGIFLPGSFYKDVHITELAGGPEPFADTSTAFGGDKPTIMIEGGTIVKF